MELFHNPAVAMIYLPALILALGVECFLYMRRNASYPWRESAASLAIGAGHALAGALNYPIITVGLAVLVWRYRLGTVDLRHWQNISLLFLLTELAYYWYHRSAHRVRLLWASHRVHHSPDELTLSAAYRLSWMPILSGSWLFFMPLVWLGFDPRWVFGLVSASLLYQFWLHTTLIPRLGPLEWVFNTPSAHRVHHASNEQHLDRNYGGVLVVFDRLFGTYAAERQGVPIRYGLVHPVGSLNPLVLVYGELGAILRDVWRAASWRERLAHLFAPPGWRECAHAPLSVPGALPGAGKP
jgi:sterol desaturase/sphingolipid hydroxylase (fatty acid hydroxylase superfamily)